MDRFESEEMRNLTFFKYYNSFTHNTQKNIQKIASKGAQQKGGVQPQLAQKPQQPATKNLSNTFTYDFKAELSNLDRSTIANRMNVETNWEVPQSFQIKPIKEENIGDIVKIQNLMSFPDKFIGKCRWVAGWARSTREAEKGQICFIELNDGSQQRGLQIVVNHAVEGFDRLIKCGKDSSLKLYGKFVKSPGSKQAIEMQVDDPQQHVIKILGVQNDEKYPLSKKYHTTEFLREVAHLRPRSNFIGCVARIRNNLSMATHLFFQTNGFQWIHTPLITASDCEGAGEMFQVTTLLGEAKNDVSKIVTLEKQTQINYAEDFFKKASFLTVSGQLSVENYCCSLSNVYTFGPTFRAENSNTTRHLAEFWMIEPELAFCDLPDVMDCAEEYVKFSIKYVLENNFSDLEFLNERLAKMKDKSDKTPFDLIKYLQSLVKEAFGRVTYTDAINILQAAVKNGKDDFVYAPEWGKELQTEHEKFLSSEVFKRPVCVYNYPAICKAFYMRRNDDGKTCGAFDLLAPGVGELIGGSIREERLDVLTNKMQEKGLNPADYQFYLDLRKYGTIPHGGFGLGFERLVMIATACDNIRDVIPFHRAVGQCEF